MIATITADGPRLGVRALCEALPVPRATYYRHRYPRYGPMPRRARPPRALALVERAQVLARLRRLVTAVHTECGGGSGHAPSHLPVQRRRRSANTVYPQSSPCEIPGIRVSQTIHPKPTAA